jgi:hypothetical protein
VGGWVGGRESSMCLRESVCGGYMSPRELSRMRKDVRVDTRRYAETRKNTPQPAQTRQPARERPCAVPVRTNVRSRQPFQYPTASESVKEPGRVTIKTFALVWTPAVCTNMQSAACVSVGWRADRVAARRRSSQRPPIAPSSLPRRLESQTRNSPR